MNGRYVCSTCCTRPLRGLHRKPSPQFLLKANFISLNGPRPKGESTTDENPDFKPEQNTGSALDGMVKRFQNWKPTDPLEGLLGSAPVRSNQAERPLHPVSRQAGPPQRPHYEALTKEATVIKRLHRALERRDLGRVDALWHEVCHRYPARAHISAEVRSLGNDVQQRGESRRIGPLAESHSDHVDTQMSSKLYDQFITVFMALRRFDRAVDVWNDMILAGRQPSLASWNAFLDGCRMARDADKMEAIWKNMLSTEVKPDVGCWTTRIHGLIGCGKWELGMEALQEMGRTWLEAWKAQKRKTENGRQNENIDLATSGDIGDIVKPTTGTINAAMSALLRFGMVDAAHNVLRWGSSLGIASDVITFNTLLRPLVKAGSTTKALEILSEMESLGVKPDVVTFTILLGGLFRTSTIASDPSKTLATDPEKEGQKQTSLVVKFLAQMEAFGIPPTTHSYSTLIDGLLKYHSNVVAARAVLKHMAARNITPTPHIYTILLTHYFSESPSDLPAIDALWKRIHLYGHAVDHIFYDRIIEGYARVGDTGRLLYFLRQLPQEGKTPSWDALTAAVTALIRAGDTENVALVVEDVKRGTGLAKGGVRGWKNETAFWELVDILEERGFLKYPTFKQDVGLNEKKFEQ